MLWQRLHIVMNDLVKSTNCPRRKGLKKICALEAGGGGKGKKWGGATAGYRRPGHAGRRLPRSGSSAKRLVVRCCNLCKFYFLHILHSNRTMCSETGNMRLVEGDPSTTLTPASPKNLEYAPQLQPARCLSQTVIRTVHLTEVKNLPHVLGDVVLIAFISANPDLFTRTPPG